MMAEKIYSLINNLQDQAKSFMADYGLTYDGEFRETADGSPIKFAGRFGDKRKTEWLLCQYFETKNLSPALRITFGSFHDSFPVGEKISKAFYCGENRRFSLGDKKKYEGMLREARKREKIRLTEEKAQADSQADWCLSRVGSALSKHPEGNHPYFNEKGIPPYSNIKFEIKKEYDEEGSLKEEIIALLPLANISGKLRALQEIYPSKRIIHQTDKKPRNKNTVGKYAACFYEIGKIETSKRIVICEGFSTAASIFETSNYTVLAAISRTNLEGVVKEVLIRYPSVEILIAGDDDLETKGNPGRKDGERVAIEYGAKVVFPLFLEGKTHDEEGNAYSDFNDLMLVEGGNEVKRQIDDGFEGKNLLIQEKSNLKEIEVRAEEDPCGKFSLSKLPKQLKEHIENLSQITGAHPLMLTVTVLSSVSGLIKKRCYIPVGEYFQDLYPNIWTLCLTPSGGFKTTSMNKGLQCTHKYYKALKDECKLLEERIKKGNISDDEKEMIKDQLHNLKLKYPFLPARITPEALFKHISEGYGGIIYCSEFGEWLANMEKNYNRGLKPLFTDMYDVPPVLECRTQKEGLLEIEKPFITICGVSSLPWIQRYLTPEDLTSGFFARYLLYSPHISEERPIALPLLQEVENDDFFQHIMKGLDGIQEEREYKLPAESQKLFEKLHNEIYDVMEGQSDDIKETLAPFPKRWSPYLLKLALLLQFIEDPNTDKISTFALEAAKEVLDPAITSTIYLYQKKLGLSQFQVKCQKVLQYFSKRGGKVKRETLLKSKVLEGGSKDYDYVLENLEERGEISIQKEDSGKRGSEVYKLIAERSD